MKEPTGRKEIVQYRRRLVAEMRAAGYTTFEIPQRLAQIRDVMPDGVVNPETGQPFAQSTIMNDLKALRREWEEERIELRDEQRMLQNQRLEVIIHQAFRRGKLDTVIRALERQAKLLGLDSPVQIDVGSLMVDLANEYADLRGLNPEEVRSRFTLVSGGEDQ